MVFNMSKISYKSALKELKISESELSKIIANLETIEKAGVNKNDILNKICKMLVSDAKFRESFLKDMKSAIKKLGLISKFGGDDPGW